MWRIVLSIALPLLTLASACAENVAVVRIALRQRSTVGQHLVKTNHIAEIQGGKASLRRLISELDVLEFPRGSTRETINRSQLSLRLRLAGVPENAYRINGPKRVTVSLQPSISSDQRIIEAARAALSRQWQVEPNDLQIRMSQPLPATLRTLLAEDADLEISPFLNQDQIPGFMRLLLGLYRNQNLEQKVTVLLDVQLNRTVAVANGPLHARQLITEADFRLERRNVSGRMAIDAVTDVANKTVTRALPAGSILVNRDIRSPNDNDSSRNTEVIKRGDIVRLVARTRGLSVTLRACEALQNGRINETIRVRNLQSRKIVTGRVLNASELEVSF